MFAIAGVSGRHTEPPPPRRSSPQGQKVRVIVRSADKGEAWKKGAEVAVADPAT